jgi:zinc protease
MLDRKIAPPFVKKNSLQLPESVQIDLSSGLQIHCIEGVRQNILKVELVFKAGKWFESKVGLSHFTTQMLEKGTAVKSAAEIAEILDQFGSHVEISPGFDFVSVSIYALKDKINNLLPVFLDILTAPAFPEKEWQQMQSITIQNLKVSEEKTGFLASKYIRKNIFGEMHPYGSSVEEHHIKNISVHDMAAYFKSNYKVHQIYIVGNLKDSEIELFVNAFSQFIPSKTNLSSIQDPAEGPIKQHIDKKNTVQSSIRLGKRSLLKSDPKYFDLQILNHLLGGYFGSRLMKNIREEKGLTYGIYSSINAFQNESLLTIGADVDKTNLALAIREIKIELRKLRTEEVGAQELTLAKNHFIGSLQSDMANPFSVAEKIKNIRIFNLPENFYQQLIDRVDQITSSEITQAAESYFHEDSFFEITVG